MFRFIGITIAILILVGVALVGSFVWDTYFISPKSGAVEVLIDIPSGTSVKQIARLLEDKEVINSQLFFKVYVRLIKAQSSLQAGVYSLKSGMSFHRVVSALSHAEAKETQVIILEGYTKKQIGDLLSISLPNINTTLWNQVTDSPDMLDEDIDILGSIPNGSGLEGYLFPDTYRFREEADAKTVAQTMILTLKRRLAENSIIVPDHLVMENGMTIHEVLTLASIIEREARSAEDMAKIAGIFLTRLKIGMALQADSTVNYITGKQETSVTLEDSRIDSPYNTYRNLGLPPGPICNPGIKAILAVLNPIETDFLYFLTTKDGEVIYSKTFDEHVMNKYKYLK